jgi:hypothetical protein
LPRRQAGRLTGGRGAQEQQRIDRFYVKLGQPTPGCRLSCGISSGHGQFVSNEATLQNWIYGYQFHGDDTRRAAFESHGIPIDHPSVRRTLIGLLLNKQAAISNVAAITAVIMGRNSQFDLNDAIFRRSTPNG